MRSLYHSLLSLSLSILLAIQSRPSYEVKFETERWTVFNSIALFRNESADSKAGSRKLSGTVHMHIHWDSCMVISYFSYDPQYWLEQEATYLFVKGFRECWILIGPGERSRGSVLLTWYLRIYGIWETLQQNNFN